MSDWPAEGDDSLERVDGLCDAFEDAWQQGQRPRIEDYLGDAAGEERDDLLRWLIPLDVACRRRHEETPDLRYYLSLSPTLPADWLVGVVRPGVSLAERYEVGAKIGDGGIAVVHRGQDRWLKRQVAVKVLREQHQLHVDMVRRFENEARITSRLQHPGIVPIHDLGNSPDGRPCITMKLVEGHDLAKLLEQRVAPSQDLPRFLTIFEQICQTLAYAHAQGVIHRDLKPHNVMVGAFGEVHLMDWGFAKELYQAQCNDSPSLSAGESPVVARIEDTVAEEFGTEAGQVFGSLPYMPPEQANGDVARVDERSDVFGLGAILCEILTGRPPFTGSDAKDVFAKAKRCARAEAMARLDGCGADCKLLRLAKACLAAEGGDRPRNAGTVAKEVKAYLAGVQERLQAAERERAAAQARAEEARKTAAAEQARAEEAKKRAAAEQARAEAAERAAAAEQARAEEAKKTAAAERARAEEARARAEEEKKRATAERRARRRMVGTVLAVGLLLLGAGSGAWWMRQRQQTVDTASTSTMAEARLLLDQAKRSPLEDGGKFGEALEAARKAKKMADTAGAAAEVQQQAGELVAELEREAEAADRDRRLLARLLDVYSPREGPKHSRAGRGTTMMGVAEPTAEEQFASAFRDWGLDVDATATSEAASRLKSRPPAVVLEVAAALDRWASERRRQGKPRAEWQRLAELATALDDDPDSQRRELRELMARDRLPVEGALGVLSAALRPVPIPLVVPLGADHVRLRRLAERTDAATEPVLGLLMLTQALRAAGDDTVAERLLRAALTARPREVVLYTTLGQFLSEQQPPRWSEAVECYLAARALRPELGVNLANALILSGRDADELALLQQLAKENRITGFSFNPKFHLDRARALGRKGDVDGSLASFKTAIALDPTDAKVICEFGNRLHHKDDRDGAIACYKRAIALDPNLTEAYSLLGVALHEKGDLDGAIANQKKAIDLDPKLSTAHGYLGNALRAKGDLDGAIACYRKAMELDRMDAGPHVNLGVILHEKGDLDGAIAYYHKAIELDPKHAHTRYNLGRALYDMGRLDDAIAHYKTAIALDPKRAKFYDALGNALRDKGRLDDAIAKYKEAIRLKNDYAEAHCDLGQVLQQKGQFAEALEYRRRGHQLGSQNPNWRYPSAQWVRQCEHLIELDRKLPAILRGEAEAADAAERLALADLCQRYKRLYADAARLYADAFTTEPKLAADPNQQHRYNAACSAVLAAAGQGEGARQLPDKVATMFRRWALGWLREELAAYGEIAPQSSSALKQTIQQRLAHWQHDPDLAGLRDKEDLDKLPEALRDAWRKLWADVADLLQRVQEK